MDLERAVADLSERVAALEAVVMNASAPLESPPTESRPPGPVFLPAGTPIAPPWLGAAILLPYSLSETVDDGLQAMGFVGGALVVATLWAGPTLAHRLAPDVGSGSWGAFDWQPLDYRLVAVVPLWTWGIVAGLLSPSPITPSA